MTTRDDMGRPADDGRGGGGLAKIRTYVLALRPWSLSVSLLPALLGAALAHRTAGAFGWPLLALTLFTVVSVHGAGNVVNTYYDHKKGIDGRKADDRTLVDHLLTVEQLVSLGTRLYAAGCAGFVLLAALSPARTEHLALLYFGGLSSSFLYTGGIGFKYIALGDVLALVTFGPVSVLFAFAAQTGFVDWSTMYYAIPLALNTEAILHGNNARDLDADARAGIVTLAILIGHTASRALFAFLLFAPYLLLAAAATKLAAPCLLLPLLTLRSAFRIEKDFRRRETIAGVPRQTARLNLYFGLLYVAACFLAAGPPPVAAAN